MHTKTCPYVRINRNVIPVSVDGWSCVPFLLFTWGQTIVEVMKIMVTSLKRSQACTATVHTPKPCSRPPLTHAFTGDSWTPTGKFPVGSVFLSSGSWCTMFCCAFQESISQSYVSSGISIVGLMVNSSSRTYALPTPRAYPCSRPLLICTSKGEAQTQFCGVLGS